MRLAIVTDTFPPEVNGVARTLQRIAGGMRSKGHDVAVLRPGMFIGFAGTSLSVWSLPVPGYHPLRFGLPCRLKLTKLWRDPAEKPDIVYVATESPLGLSAINAARSLEIPVVSGYHTNFQLYANAYGMGALSRAASLYLRTVHNRTDCTFAPAEDIGADLLSEGYSNVRMLGRGVDAALFHPRKRCGHLRRSWGATDRSPVALCVGRVAREKNLDLAFQAFYAMRQVRPDTRFIIVGDGPVREDLSAAHPTVQFVGMKHGAELARHYASADLFLFPSLTETFGNVLLEAMASGLVTVSFKYAASARVVLSPENGLQAPFGNADSFVSQCVTAVRRFPDPNLRDQARATAEGISWERVLDGFARDLEDLAEHQQNRQKPKTEPATVR